MKRNYKSIVALFAVMCASGLRSQTYCIPSVSAPSADDDIRLAIFATLSNTTACGVAAPGPGSFAGGYSNFTGSSGIPNLAGAVAVPTCIAGNTYTIAAGLTMCNSFSYSGSIVAFIDFNQNGSFSDPFELVWTSGFVPGALSPNYNTYSGVVTIPCTALPGLTRLRFWESETSVISGPCTSIAWGEVEDYAVYISSPGGTISVTPSNPTVCAGGTVALTASGGSGISWSGGISNGIAFSPTATAVYSVSAGTGSCTVTRTVLVTYNPPLTVTGPTANVCANSPVTLSSNAVGSYSWSTGAISQSIIVNPSVNTTYTVSGISSAGCNTQGIATVSVVTNPTVTAVSNPTNGSCPNSMVILTGAGANSYTWSNGVSNGVAFVPGGPASYTVSGSNACGTASAAVSLSIHPLPNITGSINNPTICSGSSVILNGQGGVTYTWTGNTGNVPNNTPFFPSSTTTYTLRGTSALGCTNTAVVGVTVLISPTITPIATPTAICFGATATLSSTGATAFTWTPGTSLNTPSISVSPPVSTTYTLTRTNGPCSSTTTLNLVVNPLPLLNASSSASQVCAGTGVNIIISGPVSNTTYPAGFTSSNFTVFPNASVVYTVVGSNATCSTSATIPVSVTPSPSLSLGTSTNTICRGQNVTLNVSGDGPISYTWQPSGNVNNTTEVLSPPTTTVVTVSATNSLGCTSSQQQLITVNALPNMSLAATAPFICAGNSAVISVANPAGNISYSWNTGATSASVQVSPTVTTTYFVTGTNNSTGCLNSNFFTLSVYISTFSIASPAAICKGSTATLSASGPPTTYSWSSASGGTVAPSVTVAPLNSTTYLVTGFNGNCQTTQPVPVTVNPLPNVIATAAKNQICRFEVSAITGNGALTYSWNTGATSPAISFTLSVTTTYTLTGTDQNGCSKTVTVTQFVATCIGSDEVDADGSAVKLFPNPSYGCFSVSSAENVVIRISDVVGRTMKILVLDESNDRMITVGGLPEGIYLLRMDDHRKKIVKKIVVER